MLMIAIAGVISYLLGSIPSGLWLGLWFKGVDIRLHGSKNIGATNTLRVLGKRMGFAALAADLLKGVVSVIFVSRLTTWQYAPLFCGVLAIVGHTCSIFLRFRGGKGVATSAGVFLSLCPFPTLLALIVFLLVVSLTRMVSLGSAAAVVVMALATYLFPAEWVDAPMHLMPEIWSVRIVVSIVALLILIKHRSNFLRIIRGTENRISFEK